MGESAVNGRRMRGLATLVIGVGMGATAAPLLAEAAMSPSRVALDEAMVVAVGAESPVDVTDGSHEFALGIEPDSSFAIAPLPTPTPVPAPVQLPTPTPSVAAPPVVSTPQIIEPTPASAGVPTPGRPDSPDEGGELASGPTDGGPVIGDDQLRADGADDHVEVEVFGAAIPAPPEVGASTTTETVLVESDPWAPVRECESSGNYSINTGNGYFGAYQFTRRTWDWVVGAIGRADLVGVLPSRATPADQDRAADALAFELPGGGLHHWPVCGRLYGR